MTTSREHGRFIWHELMTPDTAAAQDFYRDVVGWTTKKWPGELAEPVDYTMFQVGDKSIGGVMPLTADAKAMGAPPSWTAYIEVPNVDETVERTKQLGGSVIVPAYSAPDVGRFAILRDPQGAVFAAITSKNSSPPESDPQNREFSWHELVTTDYKAADKFYSELFGWTSKGDHDMGPEMGNYHMFGRDRFTYGGMFNKPESMPAPPHWLHYVQVDDADAAAERATKRGATVLNGPMDVPGGDRIAAIMDPQGAMFAVHAKAAKAATV